MGLCESAGILLGVRVDCSLFALARWSKDRAPHKMYDSLKWRQCHRGAAALLKLVVGAAAQAVLFGLDENTDRELHVLVHRSA